MHSGDNHAENVPDICMYSTCKKKVTVYRRTYTCRSIHTCLHILLCVHPCVHPYVIRCTCMLDGKLYKQALIARTFIALLKSLVDVCQWYNTDSVLHQPVHKRVIIYRKIRTQQTVTLHFVRTLEQSILLHGYSLTCFLLCRSNGQL